VNNGGFIPLEGNISPDNEYNVPGNRKTFPSLFCGRCARIMRSPRIPPMVTDIVQTALSAVNGVEFTTLAQCPFCQTIHLRAHDTRTRQFAILWEGGQEQTVRVHVKRFYCRACGRLCYADGPFYEKTRYGSPVVDLCSVFSSRLPYGRVARALSAMGVIVDRWSVRNYGKKTFGDVPVNTIMGIPLPVSILSLSTLAAALNEGGRIKGAEALAACGFPSAHRAAPDPLLLPEKGDERDKEDKEEDRQV
jgi:hypothetical protein